MGEPVVRSASGPSGSVAGLVSRVPLGAYLAVPVAALVAAEAMETPALAFWALDIGAPLGAGLAVALGAVAVLQVSRYALGPPGYGRALGLGAEAVGAGMVLAARTVGSWSDFNPMLIGSSDPVSPGVDPEEITLQLFGEVGRYGSLKVSTLWIAGAAALLVGGALVTRYAET